MDLGKGAKEKFLGVGLKKALGWLVHNRFGALCIKRHQTFM